MHDETFETNGMIEFDIYALFEDGFINGAIKEAFGEYEPDETLVQNIEDAVSVLVLGKIQQAIERKPEPVNPEKFYCKYFD